MAEKRPSLRRLGEEFDPEEGRPPDYLDEEDFELKWYLKLSLALGLIGLFLFLIKWIVIGFKWLFQIN